MKRAAIYSRFSSDRQNEKSCQDQVDVCTVWAESQGYTIVKSYQDHAISGASMINRPALNALLLDATNNSFDTIICEALDRLSRDQADLAQIRKQLAFNDVSIHTIQDGEVGTIHIGIKGLMGELYLADLAQKTRRGLRAVVKDGRQAGGKAYGYDSTDQKGELIINQQQAVIIRRIFNEYIKGRTPRQIVTKLNQDAVPSPRGGKWNASTVNGSRSRQNGILQNRLYIGEIVWNRQRFIKNPATGKRVSRLNPESEWIINAAPHLQIIDSEIFNKAGQIKAEKSIYPAHQSRKPKHVFSGLLKCGCCGAGYTIYGRDRIGCAGHRERGDCDNGRTVSRQHIEQRVLSALQHHLAQPDLISEYVKAYHEERRNLQKNERGSITAKQTQIKQITMDIDRGVELLLKGKAPDSLMTRISEMETEKKTLEVDVELLEQSSTLIKLHPAAADKYHRIVSNLHHHMETIETDSSRDEIFEEVRKLVGKVVITPGESKAPVAIEVHGQLAELLSLSPACRGSMVAGAGFEPTTFGL